MYLQDKLSDVVVAVAGDIKALLMALANKQDKLTSGTNIKTINGESVLGAGDLVIEGGGAGLTLFEESRSVASPNATVPVHALTAIGAGANIDFVIAPKGTGAILAQVPDGMVTGGGKRGAGAVDFQTVRASADQVASSDYSFVTGMYNRAGGYCASVSGTNSTATGNYSFCNGYYCNASGSGSAALGLQVSTPRDYSFGFGRNLNTRCVGAIAEGYSAGISGRQQAERILLCWDTSTTTAQQLTAGATALSPTSVPVMPNNSVYYCRIRVLARNTITNEVKSWAGTALIKRGANTASTTLVGSSISSDFGDSGMDACTVSLSAGTTYGGPAVIVTGLASTTVRWVAQLETLEAT